jgi:hypothetical protein
MTLDRSRPVTGWQRVKEKHAGAALSRPPFCRRRNATQAFAASAMPAAVAPRQREPAPPGSSLPSAT